MRDLRAIFMKNVAAVEDDDRRASEALMRRLKRLTPQEFLRQPAKTFAQLSHSQYREIVAAIAPDIVLPEPVIDAQEEPSLLERLVEFWRTRSALMRAFYASTSVAIAATFGVVTLTPLIAWEIAPYTLRREFDVGTWPACARLDWSVDGCFYQAGHDLYWEWIAAQAHIDSRLLRHFNQHLPNAYIPAGSQIIICRGRGKLVRTGQ